MEPKTEPGHKGWMGRAEAALSPLKFQLLTLDQDNGTLKCKTQETVSCLCLVLTVGE
jgi:hypothetical protein